MIIIYFVTIVIILLAVRMIYLSIIYNKFDKNTVLITKDGIILSYYYGPFKQKPKLTDSEWLSTARKFDSNAKLNNKPKSLVFKGSDILNVYIENSRSFRWQSLTGTHDIDIMTFETKNGDFYQFTIPSGFTTRRYKEVLDNLKATGFLSEPIILLRESDLDKASQKYVIPKLK